ncbi:MAG TPA: hypothetical protein VN829_04770 [Dongiaceae bacterium]|nr:hypothetical protein [Dongiaceae bacterium]
MAFCPRCQKDVHFTEDGGVRRCTVCGLEFERSQPPAPGPGSGVASVVITLARAVLYTVLIFAVLLLVGLGVLFASCALSPGFGH